MVKQYFLYSVLFLLVFGIAGYFLFHLGKALWSLLADRRLHRELDQLAAESEARRTARAEANRKRLDNGCQHAFDGALGGFPPGVCHKCGLAQDKPSGTCDHVWRAGEGPIPHSVCEKCGKTYKPAAERTSL